ncbi:hypothetical protein DPEC_G00298090 [Dallia pectoralis]|uniref:Uncharacterized protein n=1 Tax=Dallia pectoralis TaxID=75939 RepID=A0ACC2FFV6_DALPE|nr:hypothetical protein DPEC_G00298090 [Dallia pectoralis]
MPSYAQRFRPAPEWSTERSRGGGRSGQNLIPAHRLDRLRRFGVTLRNSGGLLGPLQPGAPPGTERDGVNPHLSDTTARNRVPNNESSNGNG